MELFWKLRLFTELILLGSLGGGVGDDEVGLD